MNDQGKVTIEDIKFEGWERKKNAKAAYKGKAMDDVQMKLVNGFKNGGEGIWELAIYFYEISRYEKYTIKSLDVKSALELARKLYIANAVSVLNTGKPVSTDFPEGVEPAKWPSVQEYYRLVIMIPIAAGPQERHETYSIAFREFPTMAELLRAMEVSFERAEGCWAEEAVQERLRTIAAAIPLAVAKQSVSELYASSQFMTKSATRHMVKIERGLLF